MFEEETYQYNPINVLMPYLKGEERLFVREIAQGLTVSEMEDFAKVYMGKRRSHVISLVLTLIGFGGMAGLQRFYVGQTFLGIMYLITGGFMLFGVVYDLFTYERRTNEYNYKAALASLELVKYYSLEENYMNVDEY